MLVVLVPREAIYVWGRRAELLAAVIDLHAGALAIDNIALPDKQDCVVGSDPDAGQLYVWKLSGATALNCNSVSGAHEAIASSCPLPHPVRVRQVRGVSLCSASPAAASHRSEVVHY